MRREFATVQNLFEVAKVTGNPGRVRLDYLLIAKNFGGIYDGMRTFLINEK